MRRTALLLLPILLLGGCLRPAPKTEVIVSRGAGPSYQCLLPRLEGVGIRQSTEVTPDGWRMHVEMLAGPPSGWYSKGRIVYAAGTLSYLPNGASLGIGEDRIDATLGPALRSCGAT